MPRSSVVLSAVPVDGDTVAAAVAAVEASLRAAGEFRDVRLELRVVDEGAALQAVLAGVAVVSVLRSRPVPPPEEAARILPGVVPASDARWWTEAFTPWIREGSVGLAVLDSVAQLLGGVAVHDGPAGIRSS